MIFILILQFECIEETFSFTKMCLFCRNTVKMVRFFFVLYLKNLEFFTCWLHYLKFLFPEQLKIPITNASTLTLFLLIYGLPWLQGKNIGYCSWVNHCFWWEVAKVR